MEHHFQRGEKRRGGGKKEDDEQKKEQEWVFECDVQYVWYITVAVMDVVVLRRYTHLRNDAPAIPTFKKWYRYVYNLRLLTLSLVSLLMASTGNSVRRLLSRLSELSESSTPRKDSGRSR